MPKPVNKQDHHAIHEVRVHVGDLHGGKVGGVTVGSTLSLPISEKNGTSFGNFGKANGELVPKGTGDITVARGKVVDAH